MKRLFLLLCFFLMSNVARADLSCTTSFTGGNAYTSGVAACAAAASAWNGDSSSLSYSLDYQTSSALYYICRYSNGAAVTSGSCTGQCSGGGTVNPQTGLCESDTQPDDCSTDLSTGGKDLSGSPSDGECGCPQGKVLENAFTANASCVDPPQCDNGFTENAVGDCVCENGYVGTVNDVVTCVPKSDNHEDNVEAALDSLIDSANQANETANATNNTINNINNTINNISNSAASSAASNAAAAASAASSAASNAAAAASAASSAASNASSAASNAAAAAALESIDDKLDFTIPADVQQSDMGSVVNELNSETDLLESHLDSSIDSLMSSVSDFFSNVFMPEITYSGGCELGSLSFMGREITLSFCSFLGSLEQIGNILFAFCNLSALFIYLRVFTNAGGE